MSLLVAIPAMLITLILLVAVLKLNPFLAFIIVSIFGGLALGISPENISKAIQKGIGDMMGSILIVICVGAMIGKLVAESGAAQVISDKMMQLFGEKYITWGLVTTGFIIGIPLFYNVGFVLVIPIIFALVYKYKLPAVYVGLPMMAALSVAHGFLPPHPAPTALVTIFHASLGKTLLFGFLVAIPAVIIAGPLFAQTLKKIKSVGSLPNFTNNALPQKLPSVGISFFSALLPVIILAVTSICILLLNSNNVLATICRFISEPSILMIATLLVVTISLGIIQGKSVATVMKYYEAGVKDIAMIVLIIGGAGVLKEILLQTGASNQIGIYFQSLAINPLVLVWIISASIRVCLGSATVAGLTTAGIVAPMLGSFMVDPSLMVLSIGAGSLMFSHVNDPGFWMFKEYFNISLKDTFKSWSLMESIVSIVGLIGVLLINYAIT